MSKEITSTIFIKDAEIDKFVLSIGGSIRTTPFKTYKPPFGLSFDFNWVRDGVEIDLFKIINHLKLNRNGKD